MAGVFRHTMNTYTNLGSADMDTDTVAEEFASVYVDDDGLVETKQEPAVLTTAAISEPMKAKPLHGYDTAMREHAVACEAGR